MALFMEGMLSFFSPCIIPIIPIYLTMLAGKKEYDEHGNLIINRKNSIINALFFVVGIALTFFILAFATSYISIFLNTHIDTIKMISALLIILMGLVQVGALRFTFLKRERSLKHKIKATHVTPLVALLMGFTFSFSWTPCIGPVLASVFLYANTHSGLFSYLLIFVYSLGFILPFIIVSLFATNLLNILKKHQYVIKYTVIISGVILILIGISIIIGSMHYVIMKYFTIF
ncbi:cytochrome c biogenesis protein CcdA [Granulicatella sp. 19428wC4_WM01]|nr:MULTISPECIES: cytochrome c biogenesis protein CcdA [unclassified Granulicatella]MBF0779574.1 cytochrome c biogenesis protein CcdA [Granulicatella sp. 19428wC4_WM01]TFU96425.1 cytochrome c biogenesis protein CcdA [Granulicatella sp. WM01]